MSWNEEIIERAREREREARTRSAAVRSKGSEEESHKVDWPRASSTWPTPFQTSSGEFLSALSSRSISHNLYQSEAGSHTHTHEGERERQRQREDCLTHHWTTSRCRSRANMQTHTTQSRHS